MSTEVFPSISINSVELDESALDPIAKRNYNSTASNFIRIPIKVFEGIKREGGKFRVDA